MPNTDTPYGQQKLCTTSPEQRDRLNVEAKEGRSIIPEMRL